jgi:hypothetical protein
MELTALLRVLWQHRLLVALGALAAGALGLSVASGHVSSRLGIAHVRVVLDTPTSQFVDAVPDGADTLPWRAALLADLAASDTSTRQIAKAMGIAPSALVVSAPYLSAAPIGVPLPTRALDAAAVKPEPYQLAIQGVGANPIIGIDAQAPTRAQAARLAAVAIDALRTRIAAPATAADPQQLVLENVGPVRAKEVNQDSPFKAAAAASIAAFTLWCGIIVFTAGVHRRSRRSARLARAAG